MAFYIIEKQSQLQQLSSFRDCFIHFIPFNNNFHPALNRLSLIYIRPLDEHKGYIFCLNHNESLSLDNQEIFKWIEKNTNKLFVLDKKKALYYYYSPDKLFDVNFIQSVNVEIGNNCIDYYYRKHEALTNVNCLISISKHYEECENIFNNILPIIQKYDDKDQIYYFNNNRTTQVFYQIESKGIKVSKADFITHYKDSLKHPEYNLFKGKIYTQYNLYTTTSRPSNTFNNINFAAINKEDGERECYIPENNTFLELDIQGMHPRLIGELISCPFPKFHNTYEDLSVILDTDINKAKELTFKQLYGGVWDEYKKKPFFEDVYKYVINLWEEFNQNKQIDTENRLFKVDELNKINAQKLFNYIIQSYETSTNVKIIEQILNKLIGKNTQLILYTYDSFLFDYDKNDQNVIQQIIDESPFSFNIKQGKSYHGLKKI